MKKGFYLFIYISFTSCALIKQMSNEKVLNVTNCANINMLKNKVYFDAKIDNKIQPLLFDTGAGISAIFDSTVVDNFKKKKIVTFGKISGANKKSIKKSTLTAKFESELFSSENKVFVYLQKSSTKCQKESIHKGIIGIDSFFNNGDLLMLDFSNNKICNISVDEKKELIINNNFQKIKSTCNSNQIFIYLTINNKEYKFLLDTGFNGNVVIPFSKKLNFLNYKSTILEGTLFKTVTSYTNGEETYYDDVPIKLNTEIINSKILVSKSLKHQNIGLGFIKGFDWIIDFNQNQIYLKKNKNLIETNYQDTFNYLASEKNNKLIIFAKEKNQSKYAIGDQITSINKVKVTSENICEMQELLNDTEDWNTLTLETIPVTK